MVARSARSPEATAPAAEAPLGEREIVELQTLLDAVPAPCEPLDTSMLDGFLCGVLVQPQRVAESHWLRFVADTEGRPLPAGFDATRLHALARRRHRELDLAIASRRWFDPWVFELAEEGGGGSGGAAVVPVDDDVDEESGSALPSQAVYPWIAGFVTALDCFPALMRLDAAQLQPALVLLYRHLDADDLEDADDLLEEIETLEPPADLGVAVEELVRATLLLADVARPLASPSPVRRRPARPQRGR